jgi:hypothetical protein
MVIPGKPGNVCELNVKQSVSLLRLQISLTIHTCRWRNPPGTDQSVQLSYCRDSYSPNIAALDLQSDGHRDTCRGTGDGP